MTNILPIPKSIFKMKDTKAENFRFTGKAIFLTFKTHIDKPTLLAHAHTLKTCIDKYIICHENSDENHPYEHTHAIFELSGKNKWDFRNPRFFDYEDIHPNIGNLKNREKAIKYCWKEDPSPHTNLKKPTHFEVMLSDVIEAETDVDAIKNNATSWSDINGMLMVRRLNTKVRVYNSDKLRAKYFGVPLRPWQEGIKEIIILDESDRLVHWVHNESGNVGKSFFANWLFWNLPDTNVYSTNFSGNAQQFYTGFDKHLSAFGECKFVILNVSATVDKDHFNYIYEVMEALKDGEIYVARYDSHPIKFWPPTVIIMANIWPTLTKLKEDRWRLYDVTGETFTPKSYWDVKKFNESIF